MKLSVKGMYAVTGVVAWLVAGVEIARGDALVCDGNSLAFRDETGRITVVPMASIVPVVTR